MRFTGFEWLVAWFFTYFNANSVYDLLVAALAWLAFVR